MGREDFFKNFRMLRSHINQTRVELERSRGLLEKLEIMVRDMEKVNIIISGLQRGDPEKDPVNYGPVYFFVESIDGRNIKGSNEPGLIYTDPETGEKAPIIVEYPRGLDSSGNGVGGKRTIVILDGGTRIKEIRRYD